MARAKSPTLRRRVYEILEQGPHGDNASAAVSRGIALLVLTNIIAVVLESVPRLEARYGLWFDLFEIASLIVFSVEYALRLWVAGEHGAFLRLGAGRARLR